MNFPKHWARASSHGFSCWRWSDTSPADAQALAREAVAKLVQRFEDHERPAGRYGYGDRPLREPVLREFRNDAGERTAVITRNAYGCLVLNTARVMFIDVDLPAAKPSPGALWRWLVGRPRDASANPAEPAALAKADAWAQQHRGWGWRVYRTRAGLRLLATHGLFEPAAAAESPVFEAVGADPLYRRLCQAQKCFRARLTPKPWRCGVRRPAPRWPWLQPKEEQRFKDWEKRYLEACGGRATCELIATMGHAEWHPEVRAVVATHDEAARAASGLPLA